MLSILGFLAVLGPLVIVHEFGHYMFARIFGVKAEMFSIGFGPRIWGRQIGETEWRVAAVPLGGFVKLLGEEPDKELPPELKHRALQSKEPWKRFFIFFGGPLFNFIFAIFVFMAILAIGEPQVAPRIGRVVAESAAELAGFRSGDQILSVDGQPVKKFEEVALRINESPNQTLQFEIRREGAPETAAPVEITVTPTAEEGYTVYGERTGVGQIQGLFATPRSTLVGISDPKSPAAQAGVRTGEEIVSINGSELQNWEELIKAYAGLEPGAAVTLGVKEKGPVQTEVQKVAQERAGGDTGAERAVRTVTLTKPQASTSLAADLGLRSSELFIEKTIEDSPAAAAGLKAGDRLVSVGGKPVHSFFELRDRIQEIGAKQNNIPLTWERNGEMISANIVPKVTEEKDPALNKTTQYTVGVVPMLVWAQPAMFIERIYNPLTLAYRGTERMLVFSWRNLVSLKKMVTGDVSMGTLGGPILIGKLAGESISRGLIAFLTTMALLSVGLGVLNILPIPVLDGGHLLLLGIEAVRGRPLTIRQTEVIQQVGLSLILLLMVVVMRNDISRLEFFK